MKKRVKITTLEWILDMFYPCYCKGCGKIGMTFCNCCFFDNMAKNPPFFTSNDTDFRSIIVCGMKTGLLGEFVSDYKFFSRRHYSKILARFLDETVARFSRKTEIFNGEKIVIVPLPTIEKHIRERGFDHIERICKEFAILTGFSMEKALIRNNSAIQVGANAEMRLKQAKSAYKINSKASLGLESHFLLVDDVWTTGASMRAAKAVLEAELMRLGVKKKDIKISAIVLSKNSGYEFS